jgi:predicted DNA-binding protein
MTNKKVKLTSMRLSEEAVEILETLSSSMGIHKTSVMEIALREYAKTKNTDK